MVQGVKLGAPAFNRLKARDTVYLNNFYISLAVQAHVGPDMIQALQHFHGFGGDIYGFFGQFPGRLDSGGTHTAQIRA